MKVKTSITLSEDLLKELDKHINQSENRSTFIEKALRRYIAERNLEIQEAKDLEILNQRAEMLNKEAQDVLLYQVDS